MPTQAFAYQQHYTCRIVTVSVDGGQTWGSTEYCEATHVTGSPSDHADNADIIKNWLPPIFRLNGMTVSSDIATEKCADRAQAEFSQCNYLTASALTLGTGACFKIGRILTPASGVLCEMGVIVGTAILNDRCDTTRYEANKKCPAP